MSIWRQRPSCGHHTTCCHVSMEIPKVPLEKPKGVLQPFSTSAGKPRCEECRVTHGQAATQARNVSGKFGHNKYLLSRQRMFSSKSNCIWRVEIAETGIYLWNQNYFVKKIITDRLSKNRLWVLIKQLRRRHRCEAQRSELQPTFCSGCIAMPFKFKEVFLKKFKEVLFSMQY